MGNKEWEGLPQDIRETVQAHQTEAPIRLATIARAIGVEVLAATLPPGISGEIRPKADGRFAIRVNRHDPIRRQRFTIAHEIAHFILHRDQIGSGLKDDVLYRSTLSDHREAEANRLAANILMPQHLVDELLQNARAQQVEDIVNYLADRFEVSEASMKIRLGLS